MEVKDVDSDGSHIIAGTDPATVPSMAEQFSSTAPESSAKKKKKVRVKKQFSQENNTSPTIGQSSSSSFGSYHVFRQRQSSSSAFGFHPVLGQTNSGNNPYVPKPFCSTSPFGAQCGGSIFGSTSNGVFGSQSSSPLGSSSIFGASSPAFGSSASTFGSSSGSLVFGQKPTFGRPFQQSQPAFGSNFFGSTAPFGVQSKPAFGSSSSIARSAPAFGSTSTPAFGSTSSAAFGSTSSAFGLSATTFGSSSLAFGASSTPVFGATTAPAFDATKTPAFCATTAPMFHAKKASAFGAASAPEFGVASTPEFGVASNPTSSASSGPAFDDSAAPAFDSSSKIFNFGSSSAFGQSTPVSASAPAFGAASNPASSAPSDPAFDASAAPAFGSSRKTFNFGSSPAFGQSTLPSASAPAFGAASNPASSVSSGPAFDASAAPAFGSSSTTFNFGSSPAFGQSTPASANSPFATISFGAQSSSFGAQTTSITFGSASCPAFGVQSEPAFGGTSTPTFGSTASVTFGSTSSVFGLSTTTSESNSSSFGASSTPACGAKTAPALGATKTFAFGATKFWFRASPTPTFDTSSALAFATSSTTFNFGSNPAFIQSTPVSTNSPFGTISFGAQSSSFGAQATSLTFGQSAFGEQRGGSRVSPYLATPKTDGAAATKRGKLASISAMPVYKDKSHEQLRWEDDQLADKRGQAPTGQSTAAVGFGNSGIGSFWSAAFGQSPANLFASLTPTNPSAPIAPASNNLAFGSLSTSAFGSSPSGTSNTSDLFCTVSPVSTSLSGSTTQIIGVNTTSPSLFSSSGTSAFGSPSIFCPTSAAQGTPPAFSTGSSIGNSQSSTLFQSSIPALTQTNSFGQTSSTFSQTSYGLGQSNLSSPASSGFCGNLISSCASLQSDSIPARFGQTNVPFFNDDEKTPSTPKADAAFVPSENPRALVISPLEQLPSRSSVEKTTPSKAIVPPVNENCISNCYIFKQLLHDYAGQQKLVKPVFETINEGFPRGHSFRSTVILNNVRYDSLPGFSNRREAEHSAAEVALIVLGNTPDVKNGLLKSLLKSGLCKTRLAEFAARMKYAAPVYECHMENMMYSCVVEIGGVKYIGASGKSKREAEINAARTALLALESAAATVSEDDHTNNSILTVIPNKKNAPESAFKELRSLHLKKHLKKLFDLKRDCSSHQPIILDNKLEDVKKPTAVKLEILDNASSGKRKYGDSSQDKGHIVGSEVNNIDYDQAAAERPSSVITNIRFQGTDSGHGLVGIISTTHETDLVLEPKKGYLKKRQKLNCGIKMDCLAKDTTMLSSDWIRQAGFVAGLTTDAAISCSQDEKSAGGGSNNNIDTSREVIGLSCNNVAGHQVGTESGFSTRDENVEALTANEAYLMRRKEKNTLNRLKRSKQLALKIISRRSGQGK